MRMNFTHKARRVLVVVLGFCVYMVHAPIAVAPSVDQVSEASPSTTQCSHEGATITHSTRSRYT